jgi:hypothetical protein
MPEGTIEHTTERDGGIAAGAWRDGKLLVVREGATLPQRCPKCNAAALAPPLEIKSIRRQGKGIIGAAVADAIDEHKGSQYLGPVRINVYFCSRHRGRRRQLLVLSAACLVAGAGGAEACWLIDPKNGLSGAFFFPGIIALVGLAGLAETLKGENPWFTPKRFDNQYVWLKGACSKFLESLPPFGS